MGCNFRCAYCQNWSISQWIEKGQKIEPKELAQVIDTHSDCINVNFVGGEPTPYLPFILQTLTFVKSDIPTIWNSNFYMSEGSMKLLSNVVDLYLSDWKYGNDKCAKRISGIKNYLEIVQRNHQLAFRDSELVIRHLVLPNHFDCCTKRILERIAELFGEKVIVNIMPQYRPEWKAYEFNELARHPTPRELERTWTLARELGLNWMC